MGSTHAPIVDIPQELHDQIVESCDVLSISRMMATNRALRARWKLAWEPYLEEEIVVPKGYRSFPADIFTPIHRNIARYDCSRWHKLRRVSESFQRHLDLFPPVGHMRKLVVELQADCEAGWGILKRVRCPELQLNIVDELFVIATKGETEDIRLYREAYAERRPSIALWPRKFAPWGPGSPFSAVTHLALQISSNAGDHLVGILAFPMPQLVSLTVAQHWAAGYLPEYRDLVVDRVAPFPLLVGLEYLAVCGDDFSAAQILDILGGRVPHLRGLLIHLSGRVQEDDYSFDEELPSPVDKVLGILDRRYRMLGVAVYGIAAASMLSWLDTRQEYGYPVGTLERTPHLILDQSSIRTLPDREIASGSFSWDLDSLPELRFIETLTLVDLRLDIQELQRRGAETALAKICSEGELRGLFVEWPKLRTVQWTNSYAVNPFGRDPNARERDLRCCIDRPADVALGSLEPYFSDGIGGA
ncbi:uncharacterized protein MKK02DRAFT_39814 [Dioszegia hungarica]|uniref:Uncharacterized protein n=1 Tax=Dioszegia hungarica TaxID=4972 RepID=A0AA38LY63_9TREE|nr:uncharacterized protein MKK02DRAFT_39814 [Dioszegia hungarica]KAI9639508.1 hypothetical protein MKK02DRAFT_39814 [Dioszegia hungarica]